MTSRFNGYGSRFRARYLADFVFIHINKTAGSSIERALRLPFQHRTALEIREELGERRWAKRFRFAFVRNPWDRVASHYRYRVRTNQTGLRQHPLEFNEWVRLAYGENDPRYYDKPKMFMPQTAWISDRDGHLLVDFIGRFETLDDDFRTVCRILGRRAELPHLKKTSGIDYRSLYSAASAEIVGRWFAEDVARFAYEFR